MRLVVIVFLALALSCQCGPQFGGGSGGGSGGTGGSSGAGGGSPGGTCPGGCPSGQFCAVTNTCVDQGKCGANQDCADGMICEPGGHACVPGSSCGSTAVGGALVSPSMIVSLDRSCSMTEKVGMKTKWEIAVAALNGLTTAFQDRVWFGLTMFPDTTGTNCSQDAIPVPIGPMKEPPIQTMLTSALDAGDAFFPDGPCVTNIDTGVQQAATDPGLRDPARRGFVLLLTDGAQSGCNAGGGNNGTATAISNLRDAGVDTFVIGFGGAVNVQQLNTFADLGGQATGDPMTHFYKAEDQMSLEAALSSIGARTLGCTYTLTMMPPDPSRLFVFFDKTRQVLQDPAHSNGWDYDAASNRVTFYGPPCDDLKMSRVMKLDIVYGCPVPGIN